MMLFANSDKNDACQNTLILLLLLMILMVSYVYWIVVLIAYKWYKEMVLFTLMTQTHRLPSVYMLGHPGDVMVRSSPAPISMIPPHSVDQEKTVIIPSYICIKLLNQHVIFQNMRKRLQLSISLIFEDINNLKLVLFWIQQSWISRDIDICGCFRKSACVDIVGCQQTLIRWISVFIDVIGYQIINIGERYIFMVNSDIITNNPYETEVSVHFFVSLLLCKEISWLPIFKNLHSFIKTAKPSLR